MSADLRERGSGNAAALAVAALMVALALAALRSAAGPALMSRGRTAEPVALFGAILAETAAALAGDPTPSAHSLHDPVHRFPPRAGVSVRLVDLSSRLPGEPQTPVSAIVNGLPLHPALCETATLERLVAERTGSPDRAARFATGMRALAHGGAVILEEHLRRGAGADYHRLDGLVTVEGLLNVNMAAEETLREAAEWVIRRSQLRGEEAERLRAVLTTQIAGFVSERRTREILPHDVEDAIGRAIGAVRDDGRRRSSEQLLRALFGTRTHYWLLVAETDRWRGKAIILSGAGTVVPALEITPVGPPGAAPRDTPPHPLPTGTAR